MWPPAPFPCVHLARLVRPEHGAPGQLAIPVPGVAVAQRGAHQKEGGRHPGLTEVREGEAVVVLVAVVEGDRHRPGGRQPELPAVLEELVEAHRLIATTSEPAEPCGESPLGHDVAPCALIVPADRVVHQDHRGVLQPISGVAIGHLPPDAAPEGVAHLEARPALPAAADSGMGSKASSRGGTPAASRRFRSTPASARGRVGAESRWGARRRGGGTAGRCRVRLLRFAAASLSVRKAGRGADHAFGPFQSRSGRRRRRRTRSPPQPSPARE